MQDNVEKNIIATLAYFDVFSYPLTLSQILKYVPSRFEDINDLKELLEDIPVIKESQGYYCLMDREEIIQKRKDREEISIKKMVRAEVVTKLISVIPFIQLIGVSGSLSMRNAELADDIDLFIVTQSNRLWLTRLLVVLALMLAGQKRKRNEKVAQNKICPNMFVADNSLQCVKSERTLYMAHEIVQMKVTYDKNATHNRLLASNNWISKFFPNIVIPKLSRKKSQYTSRILSILENVLYILQNVYMKRHKTLEKVGKKIAKFHPLEKGKIITELYEYRLDNYLEKYNYLKWTGKEDAAFYFNTDKHSRIIN